MRIVCLSDRRLRQRQVLHHVEADSDRCIACVVHQIIELACMSPVYDVQGGLASSVGIGYQLVLAPQSVAGTSRTDIRHWVTEPKVELPTEDVIVERVRHLDLNVVLLCEEAMHLPDAQVTRKILAARCSSSDVMAGAGCECRDVRYNGISLHSMFGNIPCPPWFSSRGQLCSMK